MADLEKTVAIIFNAVDNTGGGLATVGSGIDKLSKSVGNIVGPFDALADKVKVIDTALVGLALALGGAALQQAGEFGAQIAEIGTVMGGTAEDLAAFKNDIEVYAAGSTQSLKSINSAIYEAISAGISYKDSIAFVAAAEKLAVAGNAELDVTLKALIGTMNAYGATSADVTKFSDIFFQTVKLGTTTLPELAAGLGQVTGLAASAGIPFTELSAAVAGLTAYGTLTPQALTGIKAAISNIIDPAEKAKEAAKALGIQFDANALQSKGFAGVLGEVYKATDGNVGKMALFFGSVEGLNAALKLGKDVTGTYAKSLQAMGDSAGSTQTAFEMMSGAMKFVIQNMENNLKLLLESIGEPLLDEFSGLSGAITAIFQNLKISVDKGNFAPLYEVIGTVSNDLSSFLVKVANALPEALSGLNFDKLVAGIQALAGGFGEMFDGLELDTAEGLKKTIQTVIDAIGNLLAQGGGIAKTWGTVIDEVILPAIKAFANLSTEMSKSSGQALGWADALKALSGVFGSIGTGLNSMGKGMESLADAWMLAIFSKMIPAAQAFGLAVTTKTGIVGIILVMGEVLGKVFGGAGPMEIAISKLSDLAFGSDETAKKIKELEDKAKGAGSEVKTLADGSAQAADGVAKTGEAAGAAAVKTGEYAAAQAYAAVKTEYLAAVSKGNKDEIKAAGEVMLEVAKDAGKLGDAQQIIAAATKQTGNAFGDAKDAAKGYTLEIKGNEITMIGTAKAHEDAKPKIKDFASAVDAAGAAAQGNTKDLAALTKTVGEFQVQMAKIAADLQGKIIEAQVGLDISEIEANAKIATAIIDSLSKNYAAASDLLGTLAGQIEGEFDTASELWKKGLADATAEQMAEMHEKEMALVDAQIDYLQKKTSMLSMGNPLVTINADGLEPEVTAFMSKILSKIQTQMALEGGDFLLGGCSL